MIQFIKDLFKPKSLEVFTELKLTYSISQGLKVERKLLNITESFHFKDNEVVYVAETGELIMQKQLSVVQESIYKLTEEGQDSKSDFYSEAKVYLKGNITSEMQTVWIPILRSSILMVIRSCLKSAVNFSQEFELATKHLN